MIIHNPKVCFLRQSRYFCGLLLPIVIRRFLPAILLALLGAAITAVLIPIEIADVNDQLTGFPYSHAMAHHLRPGVLTAICFIPALGALYYGFSKALDRYLIRQFLGAFSLCFSALFAIWFISDLSNNVSDFKESDHCRTISPS